MPARTGTLFARTFSTAETTGMTTTTGLVGVTGSVGGVTTGGTTTGGTTTGGVTTGAVGEKLAVAETLEPTELVATIVAV